MSRPVRVRFAPSPTGYLHVGGARTALFNWLYARRHGGTFILRIEDTDAERSTEESTKAIYEGMRWLGLTWDEGPDIGGPHAPYVQTERKAIYHAIAGELVAKGLAYPCFCTPDELKERRELAMKEGRTPGYDGRCRNLSTDQIEERKGAGLPMALRIRTPPGESSWVDAIKGEITFDHRNLEDFVILKSDGNPTYNFAASVDDIRMEITHVLRGDDHVSNTPRQIILYRALGAELPVFGHLPMILGGDGSRLSKRHGATAVDAYADMGFVPDAMINYLALLGWSLDGEREVFSRQDLIANFSLERCGSNASVFDIQKLEWMNGLYLREMPVAERTALVTGYLAERGLWPRPGRDEAWLNHVVDAVGDRLKRINSILDYAGFLFTDEVEFDPVAFDDMVKRKRVGEILPAMREMLARVEPFDLATTEAELRKTAEGLGLKAGDLIHPTRVALSGKKVGPGIFEVIVLTGREEAVKRLDRAERLVAEAPAPASS
ncbi:MAG TPA: glutamate--tRNA ligase [Candidatus Eisenbacteria bacterium]